MTQWQMRSRRKPTGSLKGRLSKKKKYERGRDYISTHLAKTRAREIRTRGGSKKTITLATDVANIMVDGRAQKTKIKTVLENPADPHLVRRNIITKGAIIDTELGKARVTSRPGRDGAVNAVLIEGKK